jgi:hypothetical protein
VLAQGNLDINHGLAGLRHFTEVLIVELLKFLHGLVYCRALGLLVLRLLGLLGGLMLHGLLGLSLLGVHDRLAEALILGVVLLLLVLGVLQYGRVVHNHWHQFVHHHRQVRLLRIPPLQVRDCQHVLLADVVETAHNFLRQVLIEVAHRWRHRVVRRNDELQLVALPKTIHSSALKDNEVVLGLTGELESLSHDLELPVRLQHKIELLSHMLAATRVKKQSVSYVQGP